MKKIFIPLALVILSLFAFVAPTFSTTSTFNEVGIFLEEQSQGLIDKKNERKAELDRIRLPSYSNYDKTELQQMIADCKEQIDLATSVDKVDEIFYQFYPIIMQAIELANTQYPFVNSKQMDAPSGYLTQHFIILKDYYFDLVLNATDTLEATTLINEALQKREIIIVFENDRNDAIVYINEKQPESDQLSAYVGLLQSLKAKHIASLSNLEPVPLPKLSKTDYQQAFNNLLPQFSQIKNAFNAEFGTLVGKMETHNNAILQATSTQRAIEIVNEIFTRVDEDFNQTPSLIPSLFTSELEQAVIDRLKELSYTDEVANEVALVLSNYFTQIQNIRATIDDVSDLDNATTDINTITTSLKSALSDVKIVALEQEAVVAFHKAEAKTIDDKINALTANSSIDEINSVRMEYEKLSPASKAHVKNLQTLLDLSALKDKESPIIIWGVVLIIVGFMFLALAGTFLFIIIKKKKESVT